MRDEIFVRCRKGTRVIELKIETARKNVNRGWIIEDPRYTAEGHLITEKVEPKEPKKEVGPIKKEVVREKLQLNFDQSDLIEKIAKMRSVEKLNALIEGDNNAEVKFAATQRIEELNK